MRKITVIIPCFNEEKHLEGALESVKWGDEIMVVDSFSTDRSLDIAKKYTDFIIQRAYENSASQKNWAIPQATHDWILLLDADERVTPELQAEIQMILAQEDKLLDAYWINRVNFFMNKRVHHVFKSDKVVRLFHKKCRYEPLHVHAEIITKGLEVATLQGKLEHHTFKSVDHYMNKMNRYADWSARDHYARKGRVTFFHLLVKPFYRFFKHYILERGFLDGRVGFILSSVMAWAVFLRYWKMIELQQAEQADKI